MVYRVAWEEPLKLKISDKLSVIAPTPPSSGAIVAGILKIMKEFNATDVNEEIIMQRFIEAMKFAYAQRSKLGDWHDPKVEQSVRDTVKYIQSEDWIKFVKDRLKDDATSNDTKYYGANYQYTEEDHGTSSISVISKNGDAVAATSTINFKFGSGVISPSTHIILNDEMDDFSSPNVTNGYGFAPSEENFIAPRKRPQSSMSPILVTDENDNIRLAIGGSGGSRIISGVAYVSKIGLQFQSFG